MAIECPSDTKLAWQLFQAMFPHVFDGDEIKGELTSAMLLDPLKKNGIGPTFAHCLSRVVREHPDRFRSDGDIDRVRRKLIDIGVHPVHLTRWQALEEATSHIKRLRPMPEGLDPELERIDELLQKSVRDRGPMERRHLYAMHVDWLQGGGSVHDEVNFRGANYLANMVRERDTSSPLTSGSHHLFMSTLWGDAIDVAHLNRPMEQECYRDALGKARYERDFSIANGRISIVGTSWSPRSTRRIKKVFGWPGTTQLPLDWRGRFYVAALAAHPSFVDAFHGARGMEDFAARYFSSDRLKARKIATCLFPQRLIRHLRWAL